MRGLLAVALLVTVTLPAVHAATIVTTGPCLHPILGCISICEPLIIYAPGSDPPLAVRDECMPAPQEEDSGPEDAGYQSSGNGTEPS